MEKHQGMATAPAAESYNFPAAPPSYNEAVYQQPAYNPQFAVNNPVQSPHIPVVQAIPAHAAPAQIITVVSVGPKSCTIQCPSCHQTIKTKTELETNKTAHIAALVLCLIGCYLCCCIPYCMDTFKNVQHKCPNCNAFIGTYRK